MSDLQDSQRRLDDLRQSLLAARRECAELKVAHRKLLATGWRLIYQQGQIKRRRWLSSTVGNEYTRRILVFCFLLPAAFLLVLIPTHVLTHSWVAAVTIAVLASPILYLKALSYGELRNEMFYDSQLASILLRQSQASLERQRVRQLLPDVASQVKLLETQCAAAESEVQQIKDDVIWKEDARKFLQLNWRAMRGADLELHMAAVFVHLGYSVEVTQASRDQGVDLIVTRPDTSEFRAAVQIKGYFASVGNPAVQQAYAGARHYACDYCVVVTNSKFTASARQLAASTHCHLVDETSLPRLVMGNYRLFPRI